MWEYYDSAMIHEAYKKQKNRKRLGVYDIGLMLLSTREERFSERGATSKAGSPQ
jgi:hypothetical protein